VLGSAGVAQATPCGRADIDVTFPPHQATGVPQNAVLSAHYAAPALYQDEPVALTDSGGNDVAVTAAYDDADALLRATPDAPLVAGTYQAVWPGLRGVSGASASPDVKVSFDVGTATDMAPPTFSGLVSATWDLARDKDPCLGRIDDRFVFELEVGTASDDSGAALLSMLVFQTKDPLAPDQTEPSRIAVQAFPGDHAKLEVRRPAREAGQTCFAAIAQDLVGSVSGGGDHEVCVTTKKPPFFDGCSFRAGTSSDVPAGIGCSVLVMLVAWSRRGQRARSQTKRGA
jgi:hypothetical protein